MSSQTHHNVNKITVEILDILADVQKAMSSKEIAEFLKDRGISLDPRTVRYHLTKMEKEGLIAKAYDGKRTITKRGLEELRRSSVFERLGEFSERIEYNIYASDFDIYTLKGSVPTNIAIIDKKFSDEALSILVEIGEKLNILVSNKIAIADEDERLGTINILKNKFGIAVISNTIYDVIMRGVGVFMLTEFAGLLSFENYKPRGLVELISYSGLTLSPGWLFIKSGLTSVYKLLEGSGNIITAIRSFSKQAIDIVRKEIEIAKTKGFGGVVTISHPSDKTFSLPPGNRARVIIAAGLNYLAPLQELGLNPELKINETLINFKEFKEPEYFV